MTQPPREKGSFRLWGQRSAGSKWGRGEGGGRSLPRRGFEARHKEPLKPQRLEIWLRGSDGRHPDSLRPPGPVPLASSLSFSFKWLWVIHGPGRNFTQMTSFPSLSHSPLHCPSVSPPPPPPSAFYPGTLPKTWGDGEGGLRIPAQICCRV